LSIADHKEIVAEQTLIDHRWWRIKLVSRTNAYAQQSISHAAYNKLRHPYHIQYVNSLHNPHIVTTLPPIATPLRIIW